jgi:hypothetical protein
MAKKDPSQIYCCKCEATVTARLTDGAEIYPHRQDLADLPFWKCDDCGNYVGCHHKTSNPTNPLGNIPYPELRNARQYIHLLIDPAWESGRIKRKVLYAKISDAVGWPYHTSKIRSVEEARDVYRKAREIIQKLNAPKRVYFHHPESCNVFYVDGEEEIANTWAADDGCLCEISERGYHALNNYYNKGGSVPRET